MDVGQRLLMGACAEHLVLGCEVPLIIKVCLPNTQLTSASAQLYNRKGKRARGLSFCIYPAMNTLTSTSPSRLKVTEAM